MLQKILWAAGSVGVHAVLVTAALSPPAVHPAGIAAQPLTVRLLAGAGRHDDPTGMRVLAGAAVPLAPSPDALLTAAEPLPPAAPATSATPNAYLPSSAMERRPTPVSEPDVAALKVASASGLPVRLRLYIDRLGKVVDVVTLAAATSDAGFVLALIDMFRATTFLPGQRAGVDVPSYMDIELIGR
ncbi:MAG: hypothetical protein H7234_07485 [Herminiimonas sp.]|nr:hypothetical protein [Herminiimonas sp.]